MNTDRNQLQGVPCLAGRDAYHLTTSEFNQLAPLMANNSAVADQVKVLDHLLNGVYHPLAVEPNTAFRPGERSTTDAVPIIKASGLSAFPNPFTDAVRFEASDGNFIKRLTVSDIAGKIIFDRKYGEGEASILWPANGASDGILLYRCTLSNGAIVHGKLLHSKKQ